MQRHLFLLQSITPGVGYAVGDTVTLTNFENSGDAVLTIGSVGDTLGGIPIASINASFTTITNYGIDSFCVTQIYQVITCHIQTQFSLQ